MRKTSETKYRNTAIPVRVRIKRNFYDRPEPRARHPANYGRLFGVDFRTRIDGHDDVRINKKAVSLGDSQPGGWGILESIFSRWRFGFSNGGVRDAELSNN